MSRRRDVCKTTVRVGVTLLEPDTSGAGPQNLYSHDLIFCSMLPNLDLSRPSTRSALRIHVQRSGG